MVPRHNWLIAGALCTAFALQACVATRPAPTPSPSAQASPSTLFTDPDKVFYILHRMEAAAGSEEILKIRITRDSAEMAMVVDGGAQTWAWRDGGPVQVDGDTKNVGQARFTLKDFRFDDFDRLLATAKTVSGSSHPQELQVVEYANRRIYITVTTVPESVTVFFRPDGTLVPRLDLATQSGQRKALADVLGMGDNFIKVGYASGSGVYADTLEGHEQTVRFVRHAWFPVRSSESASTQALEPLPRGSLDAEALSGLLARLSAGRPIANYNVSMNDTLEQPVLQLETPSGVRAYTLDGTDVTLRLKK